MDIEPPGFAPDIGPCGRCGPSIKTRSDGHILPEFPSRSIPKTNCLTAYSDLPFYTRLGAETRWTILSIFASLPSLNFVYLDAQRCGQGCPGHACDETGLDASHVRCDRSLAGSGRVASAERSTVIRPISADDLLQSIRDHGILVALVIARGPEAETWEVISGHRRLACALALELPSVPCEIRSFRIADKSSHWRLSNTTASAKNLQSDDAGS